MKHQRPHWHLRLLAICALMLLAPDLNAQKAFFQWARLLTGFTNEDQLRTATIDTEGDIIASYYRQDVSTAVQAWRSNLVMKIDTRTGDVLWSHRQLPSARGLGAARDGAVYVTGSLAYLTYINDNQVASLGGSQTYFSSRGITTEGTGGGYLARLSPATGAIESIRHFGTSQYVMPYHLAVAPDGDFVIFGIYMRAGAQFGDVSLPTPSTSTTKNLFVAKLGPAGEVRWAKAFVNSDPSSGVAYGLAVDRSGHVVVHGYSGTSSLDGLAIDGSRGFFAKLNSDGSLVWAKEGFDGRGVSIDNEENIYQSKRH